MPVVLIGMLVACHDPAATGDARACVQTYEFGNTGCFEVEGQVVGARGQALSGISVGARPLPGPSLYNSVYETTDTEGRFRFRLFRMVGGPPPMAAPDTQSVFVVAADPRSAGVGVPATVRDSVLTTVSVAPVGSVPVATQVRITLAVP